MHVRNVIELLVELRSAHAQNLFLRPRTGSRGDDSVVVVAVEKRERAIYFKRWRRRWRKPVNVVTPYNRGRPPAALKPHAAL